MSYNYDEEESDDFDEDFISGKNPDFDGEDEEPEFGGSDEEESEL